MPRQGSARERNQLYRLLWCGMDHLRLKEAAETRSHELDIIDTLRRYVNIDSGEEAPKPDEIRTTHAQRLETSEHGDYLRADC